MGDTLKAQGCVWTKQTQQLIYMLDQFFDCMNVSQTFQGQKARKDALFPYCNLSDWRFNVSNSIRFSIYGLKCLFLKTYYIFSKS